MQRNDLTALCWLLFVASLRLAVSFVTYGRKFKLIVVSVLFYFIIYKQEKVRPPVLLVRQSATGARRLLLLAILRFYPIASVLYVATTYVMSVRLDMLVLLMESGNRRPHTFAISVFLTITGYGVTSAKVMCFIVLCS